MKENNKKLLLALFPPQNQPLWLTQAQLWRVCPQLSAAGLQSALFGLEKAAYLLSDKQGRPWRYSLSAHGQSFLKQQFPALSGPSEPTAALEQAALIIFLSAPATDRNFRYLRHFLGKQQAVALTRAVFLCPHGLSELVRLELERSYREAVLVIAAREWLFGDQLQIIGRRAGLQDLASLYSSISSETERLLAFHELEKSPMLAPKHNFNSVFDRFVSILATDQGIIQLYFPQVVGPKTILAQLQNKL